MSSPSTTLRQSDLPAGTTVGATIGVALITHCAKEHLSHCVPRYLRSRLNPRVLVVNSSSNDGTVELARELGAETLVIPRREFNHGSTREFARKNLGTDIVVMATPDAYPISDDTLDRLVRPIVDNDVSVAYARQIAHDGADTFEAFPREFNYPTESHIRSLSDIDRHGVYTFFCSDSCAAYRNSALDEIGGFETTLTAEDTYAVARLLRKGHKIAYVADAVVKHSHRYSLMQEFKRYFDTGLSRQEHRDILECGEGDEKRGRDFTVLLTKRISKERPHMLPYAWIQSLVKWLGYRIGRASTNAPTWFKQFLSSQDYYWTSRDYLEGVNPKRERV